MVDKQYAYVGMKVIVLHDNSLFEIVEILKYGVMLRGRIQLTDYYARYEEIIPYKEYKALT